MARDAVEASRHLLPGTNFIARLSLSLFFSFLVDESLISLSVIVIKNGKSDEGDWVNSNEKNFDILSNDIGRLFVS